MQVSAAVDDYLETLCCTRRPRTLESATQILNEFGAQFGSRKLTNLKRRDLLTYIDGLGKVGNSPRTQANKFVRIVAMLRHHEITITKKGDRPRFTRTMPHIYEDNGELERFFAACDGRQRVFFKTLLMTGLRMSEAKFLEWGDFKNNILHVQAHPPRFTPKTHEERKIPVHSSLWKMLRDLKRRPGKLVFPTKSGAPDRHMLRHCKRIAARAGLDPCDWWLHKFRATYCTTNLRKGVDLRTVMNFMGHANLQATLRYLCSIEAEQLRGRMEDIWGPVGRIGEDSQAPRQASAAPESKAGRPLPAPVPSPPLPSMPAATSEDFTDGVIFYEEPQAPKRNGNGNELGNILSASDVEIVHDMATGKSTAEIARSQETTENAVKMRIHRMLVKTGCRDRLQLAVQYARENLAKLRLAAGVP